MDFRRQHNISSEFTKEEFAQKLILLIDLQHFNSDNLFKDFFNMDKKNEFERSQLYCEISNKMNSSLQNYYKKFVRTYGYDAPYNIKSAFLERIILKFQKLKLFNSTIDISFNNRSACSIFSFNYARFVTNYLNSNIPNLAALEKELNLIEIDKILEECNQLCDELYNEEISKRSGDYIITSSIPMSESNQLIVNN